MNFQQESLLPEKAFLFMPEEEFRREGKGKQTIRWIFEGGVPYDKFQRDCLEQLVALINSKKIKLIDFYKPPVLLRFIQANKFDIKNTLDSILANQQWRKKTLPLKLRPEINKLLQQGLVYCAGRDHCYRPLIIVNFDRFQGDLQKQTILQLTTYFFQFLLRELLIQGQVENWFVIIDLADKSLFSVLGLLKDLVPFLSNTYRCRMVSTFIVNSPGSIAWNWSVFSKLLDQRTVKKISFTQLAIQPKIFKFFNKSQIQKKYGGSANNIESSFFPPRSMGDNYQIAEKSIKLINQQQYYQLFAQKKLQNRKICKTIVNKFQFFEQQKRRKQKQAEQRIAKTVQKQINAQIVRKSLRKKPDRNRTMETIRKLQRPRKTNIKLPEIKQIETAEVSCLESSSA